MFRLRAVLFAILFYLATAGCVLAALLAAPLSRRALLWVVLGWTRIHYWLSSNLLGIETRVEGAFPPGAMLFAVKHQAMFETLEIVRLTSLPVMVMKVELADIPLFGKVTRLYGVITVERLAGAKALRAMVAEGRKAKAEGRPVAIFPEGTRVKPGTVPPLRPGFAGMYKALGLPVVPVAVDSGRLWGKALAKRPGGVTFRVGETIPPGLDRDEVEIRVHAAINALESAAQAGA